jgi:hypothetical protein
MHATSQVENAEASMARDQLTQRQIHRLALRSHPGEPLRFAHDLIVDLDVRPYTPEATHCLVYHSPVYILIGGE